MAVMVLGGSISEFAQAAEVNIYSYRKEHLIRPLLDAFTKETGVEVRLVSGKAEALLGTASRARAATVRPTFS